MVSSSTMQRPTDKLDVQRVRLPSVGVPHLQPLTGRDTDLATLCATVCGGEATVLTALNGLPGVGKTALATALVYHPDVGKHFRGGVF